MAVSLTTLSAALAATDLTLKVASATGFSVGRRLRINNEIVAAITAVNGTTITVRGRGDSGSTAVAHGLSSPVAVGDGTDFPALNEARDSQVPAVLPAQTFYVADGAIALPTRDTIAYLTKASAAAMTLAIPTGVIDGVRLTIIGLTDFAHVVTVAAAAPDGTSGGSTVLTSPAFAGREMALIAVKATWIIVTGSTNSGPWVIT